MYRFLLRPKWLVFHIVVVAAMVGMLAAANWQWGKYGQRTDFIDKVELREKAEPVDLAVVLDPATPASEAPCEGGSTPADIEYCRVTGSGQYLDADPFVEILQTRDGVNGSNVLSLFHIDGGPIVIVNRGFVADGEAIPAPPSGTLRIGGTARTTEVRRTGQVTDNDDGSNSAEVRRVDIAVIAERAGVTVAPVYIDFIASQPATDPPPIPAPLPTLSGGPPYLSYSIQWCIFTIAVAVGWVFAVRRSRRNRRREAAKASAADTTPSVSAPDPVQPSV